MKYNAPFTRFEELACSVILQATRDFYDDKLKEYQLVNFVNNDEIWFATANLNKEYYLRNVLKEKEKMNNGYKRKKTRYYVKTWRKSTDIPF